MKKFNLLFTALLLSSCAPMPTRNVAQVDPQIQQVLKSVSEANEKMPSPGRFSADVIENSQSRTIRLLSPQEKLTFRIDEDHLAIANFRHLNTFYIAEIIGLNVQPDNRLKSSYGAVESVTLRKEHWAVEDRPELKEIEAHALLQFKFSRTSGIRLIYNQSEQRFLSTSEPLITEAVISYEAIRSKSKPKEGFMPSSLGFDFASGYLFYSAQERLRITGTKGYAFDNHLLDFSRVRNNVGKSSSSMDGLLYTGLKASHDHGRNQTYNALQNNCTARAFDLLDTALSYPSGLKMENVSKKAIDFANKDTKVLMTYLLNVAKQKGYALPAEIQRNMVSLASGTLLSKAEDIKFDRVGNPKSFLYEIPPFVEAHLRARQLIK